MKLTADEFVLGRSGKWLSLGMFYRMPVPDRRAEFVFGTMGEVIQLMNNLPTKAEIMRPAGKEGQAPADAAPASDEMAQALQNAKQAGAPQ
jgi:hypothetical protein